MTNDISRPAPGAPTRERVKKVAISRWIFDHIGERFLIALAPDGTASEDGGHSDPQDVAKARELYERLTVIRPPAGTRYVMVTVEGVPPFTGALNEEAVRLNNLAASSLPPRAEPSDEFGPVGDAELGEPDPLPPRAEGPECVKCGQPKGAHYKPGSLCNSYFPSSVPVERWRRAMDAASSVLFRLANGHEVDHATLWAHADELLACSVTNEPSAAAPAEAPTTGGERDDEADRLIRALVTAASHEAKIHPAEFARADRELRSYIARLRATLDATAGLDARITALENALSTVRDHLELASVAPEVCEADVAWIDRLLDARAGDRECEHGVPIRSDCDACHRWPGSDNLTPQDEED